MHFKTLLKVQIIHLRVGICTLHITDYYLHEHIRDELLRSCRSQLNSNEGIEPLSVTTSRYSVYLFRHRKTFILLYDIISQIYDYASAVFMKYVVFYFCLTTDLPTERTIIKSFLFIYRIYNFFNFFFYLLIHIYYL